MGSAAIGIFGGSGFYSFLDDVREETIETPYGPPSAPLALGRVEDVEVAFLPRHGLHHQFPPHMINYRANAWAMKEVGVTRIIGPCAAGSLRADVKPGDFVVSDQLVNLTSGRKDTFYDGPITTHVSFADPYCPEMRDIAIKIGRDLGISLHEQGTVVVVPGPRFSTRAESKWFQQAEWEVINMTQYPEAYLARELQICYVNVALITDYDVGIAGQSEPVSHEEVIRVFNENNDRLRKMLFAVVPQIPEDRSCPCATALHGARMEVE